MQDYFPEVLFLMNIREDENQQVCSISVVFFFISIVPATSTECNRFINTFFNTQLTVHPPVFPLYSEVIFFATEMTTQFKKSL